MAGARGGPAGRGPLARLDACLAPANLLVEVRDARAPLSTAIEELLDSPRDRAKPRIVVLAKADLADPRLLAAWAQAISRDGRPCVALDLRRPGRGVGALRATIERSVGRVESSLGLVRAVVVGLPNVGKSTLVNRLIGHGVTRVADRPGVTRGPQWVALGERCRILDTPGIIGISQRIMRRLGPEAYKLAVLNIVPEGTYDIVDVALDLAGFLGRERLARLGIDLTVPPAGAGWLALVRRFRRGELGRFTLDGPAEGQEGVATA